MISFRDILISSLAATAAALLVAAPAEAQIDSSTSPCCQKICNADGSSTECAPDVVGGLGVGGGLAAGCQDVETSIGAVCHGGRLLNPAAGLWDCLCILGGNGGSGSCVDGMGNSIAPSQCTIVSVAGCGTNVINTPNDPACAPACEPPGCCKNADNTCTDLSKSSACTAGGGTFVEGKVCSDPECGGSPCGDGTCDANIGENCSTCAADCACADGQTCQDGTCSAQTGCCQVGMAHCFQCTVGGDNASCNGSPCVADGQCSVVDDGQGGSRGSCNGQ
jgi:hypothetical protein